MPDQRHNCKSASAIAPQIDDQLLGFARDDLVIGGIDRLDGVCAAHGVHSHYRGRAFPDERHRAVAGKLRFEARITLRRWLFGLPESHMRKWAASPDGVKVRQELVS